MSEVSPDKPGEPKPDNGGGRTMASGALRRIFKSRQKTRDIRVARKPRQEEGDDEDVFISDSEEDQRAVAMKTSNHYTLNMASPSSQSDLPYILSGCDLLACLFPCEQVLIHI